MHVKTTFPSRVSLDWGTQAASLLCSAASRADVGVNSNEEALIALRIVGKLPTIGA
jgi:hypothetical protein